MDITTTIGDKYYKRIQEIRHEIHKNPELGFCEFKTSELIVNELSKMNIEVKENVAKTGVIGLIKGKYPGKTVLLRADMDAIRVDELADVSYKSEIKGMMHACGHDGHVAGLLGAAMILNELKDELHGNVKLMFQPAEENQGGAKAMLDEGVLENPKVDAAFGAHLWGTVEEGKVAVKTGALMAAPDLFRLKIKGKGGHAALPHLAIDPIMTACEVINNLQTIVSRRTSPTDPVVISCCKIQGGHSYNVIPNDVYIKGTVRTISENTRNWIPKAMEAVIKGTTEAQGASYEFKFIKSHPVLMNDKEMTEIARKSIAKVVGEDNVYEAAEPTMGGEDFACIAQKVPSSFYFVGIAKDMTSPVLHHNSYFKWDDENLKTLSQTLAQIALDYLS